MAEINKLFDPGVDKELKAYIEELKKVVAQYKAIAESSVNIEKIKQSEQKTEQQLIKTQQQSEILTQKKIKTQKDELALNDKLKKQIDKKVAASKKAAAATKKETKEVVNLIQELQKEVKNENQANASSKKLLAVRKGLSAETAKGRKQIELINKKIDKNNLLLTQNASKYGKLKRGIGEYERGQSKFGTGLKKVGSSLMAFGGAFLGINAAMRVGKELARVFFAGTQNSADKLRIRVAGLKAQFDSLKDSIANLGDNGEDALDGVDSGLTKAWKAALMLAKARFLGPQKAIELELIGAAAEALEKRLIKLERAEANLELVNAKRRREIQAFRLIAESDNETYDARIEALKKGTALELQIDKDRRDAQKERIAISLTEKKITDEQIEQIVKRGLSLEEVGLTLTTEKERVDVIKDIVKFYDDQTQSLAKQKKLLANINTLTDEKNAKERAANKIDKTKSKKSVLDQTLPSSSEIKMKARDISQEILDEMNATIDDSPVSFWDKVLALDEDTIQDILGQFSNLSDTIFNVGDTMRTRELDSLDAYYQTKINAASNAGEETEALEREYAKKRYDIELKQAKADKLKALMDIALATAVNLTKSSLKPWMIPLILGIAATQTAIVASTPLPTAPAFWMGSDDTPDTFIAGDRGSEMVITEDGKSFLTPNKPTLYSGMEHSVVLPNKLTNDIMSSGMANKPELIKQDLREIKTAIKESKPIINIINKYNQRFEQRYNKY